MGIEDNNGDAISCIVLMLDSLAKENNSLVEIETFHDDNCKIFEVIKDREVSNKEINAHEPTSEEAREHLYWCNCNANIETTFKRGDGETLFVQFVLSDVKEKHPWLDDPEQTKDMVELASDDKENPLLDAMKPTFKKRIGTRTRTWSIPTAMGDDTGTVH